MMQEISRKGIATIKIKAWTLFDFCDIFFKKNRGEIKTKSLTFL
ncbi:MAG: hypothetical protein JWO09_3205 [Bacteroidetes bacterium]|nr:hypothetical protein [Bacteroidota bacterium]